MQIWVDANACPGVIKKILYRAAERVRVPLIPGRRPAPHPPRSLLISSVRVTRGFDAADAHIVQYTQPGDPVITGAIPLAAEFLIGPRRGS
jgi:uncharacterized protein YaiI (UPF0178 family)